MSRHQVRCLVLVLVGFAALTAFAQDEPRIKVGDTVRFESRDSGSPSGTGQTILGEVVAISADDIRLRLASSRSVQRFPLAEISGLELKTGGISKKTGGGRGALAGILLAVGIGVFSDDPSPDASMSLTREGKAFVSAVVFVPLGILMGMAASGGEEWVEVPGASLGLGAAAAQDGGLGLHVVWRF